MKSGIKKKIAKVTYFWGAELDGKELDERLLDKPKNQNKIQFSRNDTSPRNRVS